MSHSTLNAADRRPRLVLVHGWGIGPAAWDGVLPALARHYEVRHLPLPGYAGAATHASTATSLSAGAEALAAMLDEPTVLCGWSLGALVALRMAALAPAKVRRLVLVGGTASFVQRDGWPDAQPPGLLDTFHAAVASDPAATLQRFVALFNQGDTRARGLTRALNAALQAGLPASPAMLLDGLAWLRGADLRDGLADVRTPTQLIHGAHDTLMPLAAAQRLQTLLPAATLCVMRDAAHAPFLHDPEAFAALVAKADDGIAHKTT